MTTKKGQRMINTDLDTFVKMIDKMVDSVVKSDEQVTVATPCGNAVLISEAEYQGLMETIYLSSIPGLKDRILVASTAPESEFVPDSEVDWSV